MISAIQLKSGRSPGAPPERIPDSPVVVFVGPNNSGKSMLLAEIIQSLDRQQQTNQHAAILQEIELSSVSREVAEQLITRVMNRLGLDEEADHIILPVNALNRGVPKDTLVAAMTTPGLTRNELVVAFLSSNTKKLDGANRISMVKPQPSGDLHNRPDSTFQRLFRDDLRRASVRDIIYDAFGEYLVIDPTHGSELQLTLSRVAPSIAVERGLQEEAIAFHGANTPIDILSDGVKAHVGIILTLIIDDPIVLAIDEPEAFLHPSLAAKLGKQAALAAQAEHKHVYVSTHSPDFVMGCVNSGVPVVIVRLTYRDREGTARILPNDELATLMRNPLLRSTGVLSALFYEHVVVTESDADRAFYQEINERLLRHDPEHGIPNCLFINAQNKQTVQTIIRPLRHLGIPAAGIVDIDILKEGGTVWSAFLSSGSIPRLEQDSLANLRGAVNRAFEATGKRMKRDGGLALLDPSDAEAARNLFARLAEYGLFVVERGELESWLPHLGAAGHGPAWLIDVFTKMGDNPDDTEYVRPSPSDVWSFMASIRSWLVNRGRKGIPN